MNNENLKQFCALEKLISPTLSKGGKFSPPFGLRPRGQREELPLFGKEGEGRFSNVSVHSILRILLKEIGGQ